MCSSKRKQVGWALLLSAGLSVNKFSIHIPHKICCLLMRIEHYRAIYLRWKAKLSQPVYRKTPETVKENLAIRHMKCACKQERPAFSDFCVRIFQAKLEFGCVCVVIFYSQKSRETEAENRVA